MKRLGTGALAIILFVMVPFEAWSAGQAGHSVLAFDRRQDAEQEPSSSGPTMADAAKTTAEELATLSDTAYQVDCRPNMKTLPPFTRFSSALGTRSSFRVLADGSCFVDPAAPIVAVKPETIEGSS